MIATCPRTSTRAAAIALVCLFQLLLASCAGTSTPTAVQPPDGAGVSASAPDPAMIDAEFINLRAALGQEVPRAVLSLPPGQTADVLARTRAALATADTALQLPCFLVVVDRNPNVQLLVIVLARPDRDWPIVGGSLVSTGQAGRRAYFITPTGVFLHSDAILDYRAEGTFNANHIRGLGRKGMRVWDFGWVPAVKGWRGDEATGEIRLLLHATDPDVLEQRLGRPASQGCIRISAAMNEFLDRYGVLDADYEAAAVDDTSFRAVLLPDRTPTKFAGRTLVIIDSSSPPTVTEAASLTAQPREPPWRTQE